MPVSFDKLEQRKLALGQKEKALLQAEAELAYAKKRLIEEQIEAQKLIGCVNNLTVGWWRILPEGIDGDVLIGTTMIVVVGFGIPALSLAFGGSVLGAIFCFIPVLCALIAFWIMTR